MSYAKTRSKQVYNVPRPLSAEQLVIRSRSKPDRAVEALTEYDNGELSYFICAVVRMGYCVSFSATSDGGAISIVVYDGCIRFKAYGRNTDQFATSCRDLLSTLRGEE